ncbi:hypothetical protein OIU79_027366 [Salix purpurea]|uniref:Peptidase A1 domain-containing protein n=1 Tax=Salix purpurea TaxID=77065 RepID=A0A9Q0VTY3_SALPP|nr:hypothetical protein OIU79_027366 [Salix purpurea]
MQKGFRVRLKHVDSGKNLTRFERIQHGVKRGRNRLQRLKAMALVASSSSEIESPVLPGNGEYLMKLVDRHSAGDVLRHLGHRQLCDALPQSSCKDSCEYLYTYGDYSSTQGILASETLTFGKASVPHVAFGCGADNEGSGFSQGAGLVGLGRGPLSLVSQLKEPKFSYCLTSADETKTSTLLMGSLASVNASSSAIKTTPLIRNPSQPSFYYLSLEGISVGGTRLPIKKSTFSLQDDGSGGLIIDSGTTITYLEESAFNLVAKEFTSQIDLPVDSSGSTGLEVCFTLPSGSTKMEVPKMVFHFDGADLELPAENYMIGDSSMRVACLAMGSSSGMSIFGNVQQQNMVVLHDLEKETLSFLPAQCDLL